MKTKPIVIVTAGDGPFANAKRALAQLDLAGVRGKRVLVKPNAGRLVGPARGINTHPEALAGVIESLREAEAGDIAIGESPILGVKMLEAFEKSGMAEVARRYGCALIDFDAVPPVEKAIPDARVVTSTRVCAPVYEYDVLLSLPVAKCHMHTGVTLGIKNMKGCLYRREKVRYHQLEYPPGAAWGERTLDSAISDLAMILLPDITVIDGSVGMEGLGPSGGERIESDFAVASFHPLGADVVGCAMMGLDAAEVAHLCLVAERRGWPIDTGAYDVRPSDFRAHHAEYRKPPTDISVAYPDVVLYDVESCSACLSTVMLFLKRFKDDMSQYLVDGKLHIAIGKGVRELDLPEGTICVGNCAKRSGTCFFVPGCPPVPTRIYEAVTGEEPDKNEPDVS